jgi:hypothetical protein
MADATVPSFVNYPAIQFSAPTRAVLYGEWDDDSSPVVSVELFNGAEALGQAQNLLQHPTPNVDGFWELNATLPLGVYDALSLTATEADGATFSAPVDFSFQNNIRDEPYTTSVTFFNSLGQIRADSYIKAGGRDYLDDIVTYEPNGAAVVEYIGGLYFNGLNYYDLKQVYSPDSAPLQQIFDNRDGTHTIVGSANHLRLNALGDDTMTGGGDAETFVFKAHPGDETITDFNPTGPGHDVISLPAGEFASIAQIFHDAMQQSGADTVIALGPHSSITLDNVSADSLTHSDFNLRGSPHSS